MPAFVGMTNAVTMHDDDDDIIMHQHAVRIIEIMPAILYFKTISCDEQCYICCNAVLITLPQLVTPQHTYPSQMLTRVSFLLSSRRPTTKKKLVFYKEGRQ